VNSYCYSMQTIWHDQISGLKMVRVPLADIDQIALYVSFLNRDFRFDSPLQFPHRPDDRFLQGFQPVWVHGPLSGTGRGRFRLRRARTPRKDPFPGRIRRHFPRQTSAVIEICSALHAPYPAGMGKAATFRSMSAKSRRVRWLSANSNQ
jgi:hypothetical protein